MPKFSIIIPLFNSSKTILKCLDSILRQDNPNWEALLIDDGSTDNIIDILSCYLNRYNNIRYYKIPHKGVSNARNYGLNLAKGEYILFCDSDDEYINESFNKIEKVINNNPLSEVFVFGAKIFNCDNQETYSILPNNKAYTQFDEKILYCEKGARPYVWNCCYKRLFLLDNSIHFDRELDLGEDQVFQFNTLLSTTYIIFSPILLYLHNDNCPDSCMGYFRSAPPKKMEKHILILQKAYEAYFFRDKKPTVYFYTWVLHFFFKDFINLNFQQRLSLQKRINSLLKKIHYADIICSKKIKLKYAILKNPCLQLIYKIFFNRKP